MILRRREALHSCCRAPYGRDSETPQRTPRIPLAGMAIEIMYTICSRFAICSHEYYRCWSVSTYPTGDWSLLKTGVVPFGTTYLYVMRHYTTFKLLRCHIPAVGPICGVCPGRRRQILPDRSGQTASTVREAAPNCIFSMQQVLSRTGCFMFEAGTFGHKPSAPQHVCSNGGRLEAIR